MRSSKSLVFAIAILLAACSAGDADTAGADTGVHDGLLEAGVWGDDNLRLHIATDGSATLRGGCAHATLDAAMVSDGAFDWVLAWTYELAYVDTGDHSTSVDLTGTISGDRLEGTLRFDEGTLDLVLTRGVAPQVGECD